jgi:hypothetical protein
MSLCGFLGCVGSGKGWWLTVPLTEKVSFTAMLQRSPGAKGGEVAVQDGFRAGFEGYCGFC